MKVIEAHEALRILAAQKAQKAVTTTWAQGAIGVGCAVLVLVIHRPVDVGLVFLALMAAPIFIFVGLWRQEHYRRRAAQHHVQSLQTANRVLQAKVQLAIRERCPDERCSRCRATIVQRRTDFIMEQFGKLGPHGYGR